MDELGSLFTFHTVVTPFYLFCVTCISTLKLYFDSCLSLISGYLLVLGRTDGPGPTPDSNV